MCVALSSCYNTMSTSINSLGITVTANGKLRLPNGTITFAQLETDVTGMVELSIENVSDVSVTIDDILLLMGNEYQIVGLSGFSFPVELAPEETLEFELSVFSELAVDELIDILQIQASVAGAPLNFRLLAVYTEPDADGGTAELTTLEVYHNFNEVVTIVEGAGPVTENAEIGGPEVIVLLLGNAGALPLTISAVALVTPSAEGEWEITETPILVPEEPVAVGDNGANGRPAGITWTAITTPTFDVASVTFRITGNFTGSPRNVTLQCQNGVPT